MEIRHPNKDELDQMKRLWTKCFHDPEDYVDFYYQNGYKDSRTLVSVEDDGTVSAMLTIFPSLLYTKTSIYKGGYLYAVATHPRFRRQGYMARLEERACREVLKFGGKYVTLVPASPELFSMYQKLGYQSRYSLYHSTVTLEEIQSKNSLTNLSEIGESYFIPLRQLFLNSFSESVQFDGYMQHYCYEEMLKTGCRALSVQNRFGHGYIVFYLEDGELYIKEAGMKKECFEAALYSIAKRLQVTQIHIRSAVPFFHGAQQIPYGMMKCLDDSVRLSEGSHIYMNLMLD
jgi:predicted acetyltransferase